MQEDPRWTDDPPRTPMTEYAVPDRLLFATDSAEVLPAGHKIIAELADVAKHHGGHLEVDGFTDTTGTVRHNDKLSVARAQSVAAELSQNGVERDASKPAAMANANWRWKRQQHARSQEPPCGGEDSQRLIVVFAPAIRPRNVQLGFRWRAAWSARPSRENDMKTLLARRRWPLWFWRRRPPLRRLRRSRRWRWPWRRWFSWRWRFPRRRRLSWRRWFSRRLGYRGGYGPRGGVYFGFGAPYYPYYYGSPYYYGYPYRAVPITTTMTTRRTTAAAAAPAARRRRPRRSRAATGM